MTLTNKFQNQQIQYRDKTVSLHARIITAAVVPLASTSLPDLLVLTLASGYVLFIDLTSWRVSETIALGQPTYGQPVFPIDHTGWQLCSDSHGKALSLASFRNTVRLYSLSSQDSYLLELHNAHLVLHAGFLFPLKGVNAQHLFYLALYAVDNGRLKIGVYEWWTQSPLRTLSYNTTAFLPSMFADSPPIFFISIPHPDGAFALVTADAVYVYTLSDVLSGSTTNYIKADLPSFPVSFFQERILNTSLQATYFSTQRFYIGTESNVIYSVTLETLTDQLTIQPLVDLEASIGSSLIITPTNEQGEPDLDTSVYDAANLMVYTAGSGVLGGTFFVQSTEEGVIVDYLSDYQQFGPVGDALVLNRSDAFESVSPHFTDPPKPELFLSSGIGSSSSAIVHVRQGIKASVALYGFPMVGVKRLFGTVSADNLCYFVASYPFYTQVFQVTTQEGTDDSLEIIDYSEASQLDLESETLAFAAVDSALVQVTATSIIITSDEDRLAMQDLAILRAAIDGPYLAVVYKKETGLTLAFYNLDPSLLPSGDVLHLVGESTLDTEVTMLKIMSTNEPSIYVGTFTSTLRIYNTDLMFDEILLDDVANDVVSINDTLLIGLRSGSILTKSSSSSNFTSQSLGKLPVQLFQSQGHTFAHCEHLFLIDPLNPSDLPNRVHVEDSNLFSVQAACLFPVVAPSDSEIVLTAALNQKLSIIVVEPTPSVISRRIPIRAVPRRLLYLSHISMIAVLFHRSCKKSRRSHLRFVDPKRGTVITPNEENYDQWKQKTTRLADEVMYCMCEWEFRVDDKRFKYLVIGSGATSGGPRMTGYLYVMSVSKSKSGRIELQKRFTLAEDDPIYSVAQIDDKTFICATSSKIILYKLLIEDQKCKILKMGSIDPVSSPIINVTVKNGLIYASTLKNSVYVYTYSSDQGNLKLICADSVLRATVTQCVLENGTVLVADKQRSVAAFAVPHVTGTEGEQPVQISNSTLTFSGSIELPTVVARLVPLPADQDSQSVLAVGVDGSIYKLEFLSKQGFRQLVSVIKEASTDANAKLKPNGKDTVLAQETVQWREHLQVSKTHVVDWEYAHAALSHDARVRNYSKLNGVL